MKKLKFLALPLLGLFALNAASARIVEVAPGGDLRSALKQASAADTLLLKSGEYALSTQIVQTHDIVLLGEEGEKPVVHFTNFVLGTGARRLVLGNLHIIYDRKYLVYNAGESEVDIDEITLSGCIVNLNGENGASLVLNRSTAAKNRIGRITIDDCIVYNSHAPSHGVVNIGKESTVQLSSITLRNSTFADFVRGAVIVSAPMQDLKIDVENCTFYDINTSENSGAIFHAAGHVSMRIAQIRRCRQRRPCRGRRFVPYRCAAARPQPLWAEDPLGGCPGNLRVGDGRSAGRLHELPDRRSRPAGEGDRRTPLALAGSPIRIGWPARALVRDGCGKGCFVLFGHVRVVSVRVVCDLHRRAVNTFFRMDNLTSLIEHSKQAIRYWWLLLVVGAALFVVGLLVFAFPARSYLGLSMLFGWLMLLSGVLEVVLSSVNRHFITGRGWMLAGGIIEIILGVILIAHVALSAATLPLFLGFWLLLRAFATIGLGGDMRTLEIPGAGWTLFSGVLLMICSLWILFRPLVVGSAAVIVWVGISLLFAGVGAMSLSLQLRQAHRCFEHDRR